ncbi:hypothetical protein [Novosphingobium colocasiae]|uniref:hypothetical protein n=1 Tax=Novosphingobium colocasiae TaxID=1256513 RepID=UPI0035B214FA
MFMRTLAATEISSPIVIALATDGGMKRRTTKKGVHAKARRRRAAAQRRTLRSRLNGEVNASSSKSAAAPQARHLSAFAPLREPLPCFMVFSTHTVTFAKWPYRIVIYAYYADFESYTL